MEKIETYYWGTLRIKNPKTLRKWINSGKYQKLINEGFTFYPGCGRFKKEKCECSKCRRKTRPELVKIIENYNYISIMEVTNHTQYQHAKNALEALYANRDSSPENRKLFDDLLHKIVEFEIKEGIINENDIK